MLKTLKVFSAVIFAAAMLFTSCESGDGFDYVDGSGKDPVLSVAGITAVSGDEENVYLLDKRNILPGEGDGSFTVFVKNVKPAKLVVKNSVSDVSIRSSAFTATSDSDAVGSGAWKSVVSYSVNDELTEAVDGECSFVVMFSESEYEALSFNLNVKASFIQESEAYKLIGAAQDSEAMAEHSLTVKWSYGSGIEPVSVTYVIEKVSTDDEGEFAFTAVESGALESNATELTSTTTLSGKSDYRVTVKVIGTDGWYSTVIGDSDGGWITTTDDITPPVEPAVEFGTSKEDSFTVVYTKGDDTDDTVGLVISVKDSENQVVECSIDNNYDTDSTVTLKNFDDENGTVAAKGINVASLAAGAKITVTLSGFTAANVDKNYTVVVTGYDGCYNYASSASIAAKTVADTTVPENVKSVDVNLDTNVISWTLPDNMDSDFAGVYVYVGGVKSALISKNETSYNAAVSSSVKVTTVDTVGNESDGVEITIGTAPALSSSVTAGWTGQLVISDVTLNEDSEYAIITDDDTSAGVDVANKKVFVNGLEPGVSVAPTVQFVEKFDNGTVTYPPVTAGKSVAPTITVYRLRTFWPTDIPPVIVPHIASGVTSSNVVAACMSGASQTSDMMFESATYTDWIVHPSVAAADVNDGDAVSLEATNYKCESSGYYMYADLAKEKSWSNNYSNKSGWGYGYSGNAHVWVAKDLTETQKSEAGFKFVSSTSGYTATSIAGYDCWYNVYSTKNSSYAMFGSCFNISVQTTIATNGDSDVAVLKTTWTGEEFTDAPASTTALAANDITDSSVTLTWTNPTDKDFDHVEISCSDSGVATKTSTGTSATITGLSAGTTYTFTVTTVDFFGNECTAAQTVNVTTEALIEYPSSVEANIKYTGTVTVTWTDIAADGYTYKVECSDDTVAAKEDIAAGTQEAYFTGLTVGSTYTFTVTAIKGGETFSDATESKATVEVKQKKVHVMGGASKYLQVKDSSAVAFFSTGTSNEYTWVVMPALNGDESMFSLKSAVSEKYLVVDLGTDHSSETAPSGGWTSGQNTTCALILTDEPTDDTIKNQASFKETTPANGSDGWSSFLMNGDSARYLRDWWDIANCNAAQTGSDAQYSSQKFIDVE